MTPVLKNPCHSIGRGVMRYWYTPMSDQPHAGAWLYQFYGGDVKFYGIVRLQPDGRMATASFGHSGKNRHKQTGGPGSGRPSKHVAARANYLPRIRVRRILRSRDFA